MKMIEATIRHFTQEKVIKELSEIGIPGATVTELQKEVGSSAFSESDITDLPSLAVKLKKPVTAVDQWLVNQLSPATTTALATYHGADSGRTQLQTTIVKDLNIIIKRQPIYDVQHFPRFTLRLETEQLRLQNPQGANLVRLNRLLIEDAYPLEIARSKCRDHADPLLPMIKIEICLPDELVPLAIQTIRNAAKTGRPYDGIIIVLPIERCIRIRTGEEGERSAL